MKSKKYFICSVLLMSNVIVEAQTTDPSDAVGLNAVACEASATLESAVVKTLDKTAENLQYIDALQKMSDGYFKIKVDEFNAGRLTKERAGKMSEIVL